MNLSGQARSSSAGAGGGVAPGAGGGVAPGAGGGVAEEDFRTRSNPVEGVPWAYVLVFLIGTALVAGFMWYHIDKERRLVQDHWHARASTVADDRARLISAWLAARRADAEVLAGLPSVRAALGGGAADASGVVPHLDRVAKAYGYAGISIVDRQGRTVTRSTGASDLNAGAVEVGAVAGRTGTFQVDLSPDPSNRKLLSFAVPVSAGEPGRPALGAVVLA